MDELIQRAAHGRAEGLRALGSTAKLDLERFRRLVIVGERAVDIESPPLTAFLEALQLFADAFDSSGGFRLVRIARPPITLYGLYGIGGLEAADERLLQLIIQRGVLAEKLDCFLQCECGLEGVKCQVMLDKILYDVDRAINLFAVGKDDFGQAERRAAAYSLVIESFDKKIADGTFKCDGIVLYSTTIEPILDRMEDLLAGPERVLGGPTSDDRKWIAALRAYGNAVISTLTANPQPGGADLIIDLRAAIRPPPPALPLATDPDTKRFHLLDLALVSSLAQKGEALLSAAVPPIGVPLDIASRAAVDEFNEAFDIDALIDTLRQELCIQKDAEIRWKDLVKSMAPNCVNIDNIFIDVQGVVNGALAAVGDTKCPVFGPTIPPHYETSLEALVKTPRL